MAFITLKKVKPLSFSLPRHKIDRTTIRWTSSNGQKTYIADMPHQYLINCKVMIEDGRHQSIDTDSEMYKVIVREIEYKDRYAR